MPAASNVCRKIRFTAGSTPKGSHKLTHCIFYKHLIPTGFLVEKIGFVTRCRRHHTFVEKYVLRQVRPRRGRKSYRICFLQTFNPYGIFGTFVFWHWLQAFNPYGIFGTFVFWHWLQAFNPYGIFSFIFRSFHHFYEQQMPRFVGNAHQTIVGYGVAGAYAPADLQAFVVQPKV